MPLGKRIIKASFEIFPGQAPVVLDDSLSIHVKVRKDALAIQNTCEIEVYGMSQTMREMLLSQFTMWNKRQIEIGGTVVVNGKPASPSYVNVTVEAGYLSAANTANTATTAIFKGQVGAVTPISDPPNLGVRIQCYSQLALKTQWITEPAPTSGTFKQYVEWAGKQMGVSSIVCETSYDDTPLKNPSSQTFVAESLLLDIQNAYRPNVAAFIDNNILYVKDINKVISIAQIVNVSEFIGTPMWTELGVEFRCLFDPRIQLAGAATLNSKMNPGLNQTFVITGLEYDLASRDLPFYVSTTASPSA